MKTLDYLNLDEKKVSNVLPALQQLLADFQIYYANLRGFHWNIKGHGFFILHSKFEELYEDTARKVDELAERLLMLGGTPENRFSRYLEVARLKEVAEVACGSEAVDYVLGALRHFIAEERKLLDLAAEAHDDVTADLMTGYLREQENWYGCWWLSARRDAINDGSFPVYGINKVAVCPIERHTATFSVAWQSQPNGLLLIFLFDGLAQPSSSKSGSGPRKSLSCWKNCFQSSFLPRGLV